MSTAVAHFLGSISRTLVGGGSASVYHVTAVKEPFIGRRLGDCQILERIGQGAMSVVYQAKQDVTERKLAVKMMRVQLCIDPTNVKRFQREARALSRLNQANLLNVYQVGTTLSGQPFLIMDYIEGISLGKVLSAQKVLPWQRAVAVFSQVCDGMQHAHEQGLIHRDLKPDNIMLINKPGASDVVKVVDFGLVKLTDESLRLSQKLTQTGEVWGSPIYMSPEQCTGGKLDARTDIYSLGTVMYQCLTGREPFLAKNFSEIVMKQLGAEPQPFAEVNPQANVPPWLEKVVRKALEKQPGQRFQSMAQMKQALQNSSAGGTSPSFAAVPTAAERSSDPFMNKTLSGGYRIDDFIGKGGMSTVYRAVQSGTDRVVAVKMLREELCKEDMYLKRFEREAKALARVSHPGLISVFDMGVAENGQPYMIIEYLQGESLHDWIIDNGKMSVRQALPIFLQVCDVMLYAHTQGIIHRDIKPHNIMIVKQGRRDDVVKVVDFGIIKLDENIVSVSQKLTASGEICGSPMYMSPEQILDEPLDLRTDIYSFGIVMYEVLSGRPLFGGTKITEVMNKHVNVRPQPLPYVVPDSLIPSKLDLAVRKCLEKSRNNRFQTMGELKPELADIYSRLDALLAEAAQAKAHMSADETTAAATASAAAAEGSGVTARGAGAISLKPALSNPGIRLHWENRRNRMVLLAAAVVLLVLTAAVVAYLWMSKESPGSHDGMRSLEPSEPQSSENAGLTPDNHRVDTVSARPSSTGHPRHQVRHRVSDSTTVVEEMNATEKAHLQHHSSTSPDPFAVMKEQH